MKSLEKQTHTENLTIKCRSLKYGTCNSKKNNAQVAVAFSIQVSNK